MSWTSKGVDYPRLHAILRRVLPHHKPISERLGGELGTFKSIDSEGNVWLVQFQEPTTGEKGETIVRRSKRMALAADDAASQANGGVPTVKRSRTRADLDW